MEETLKRIKSKKYSGIYLNKLQDGDVSYYITYKDMDGKKCWTKIGLKSNGITEPYCNQKRLEIVNQMRLGELPSSIVKKRKKVILSLDEIANKYFEYIEVHNRDIQNPKSRYNNHIKPSLGSKDVFSITIKDIEKLQREKMQELSPKTVNHILQTFGTIINHAIEKDGLALQNPLKIKKLNIDNQRERYLTTDEIQKLLQTLIDDWMLTLFAKLSLSTGGRVDTIMHICKKDVDLYHHMVRLKDFKNDSSYAGFLTDEVILMLNEYLQNLEPNDFLIQGYAKSTVESKIRDVMNKLFNTKLAKDDRKNRCVTHTLRHTFASHLAINGTPIYTIQKLMNHKEINMTLRYAKLAPDSGKNMVKGLYQ